MFAELQAVLRDRRITTLFQPIALAADRSVWAHEALSRGPADSGLHSPNNLFATARVMGVMLELEHVCMAQALRRFAALGLPGRLFLNMLPESLLADPGYAAGLGSLCRDLGVDPTRCVVELTEQGLLHDYSELAGPIKSLRAAGIEIAIDDFGAGTSGIRTLSELRPEYVKIDRYFVNGIDADPVKVEFMRSIVDMGRAIGSKVIAEGVETLAECREVLDLGADALQGFFLARPSAAPAPALESLQALEVFGALQAAVTAEQLATDVPVIGPRRRIAEVVELFRQHVQHDAFPVVRDDGRPVGIVRRDELLTIYSRPLHPELYNKKPIESLMDRKPLLIDARLRLEQVSRLVTRRARLKLDDAFLVVKDGHYLGLGQTVDLLRQLTELQVRTATYSNPLTMLPGNVPINECIDRLLAQGRHFHLCYVDLDHFKPFNDCYGYVKGDQVLLHVAQVLKSALCPRQDFLGHVGGDDFIAVLRSPDWDGRLRRAVETFAASIGAFHSPEHRASGGIDACDRDGRPCRFPLLSMSLAVLDSHATGFDSADKAGELLQPVKSAAKRRPGNSLLLFAGDSLVDLLGDTSADPRFAAALVATSA